MKKLDWTKIVERMEGRKDCRLAYQKKTRIIRTTRNGPCCKEQFPIGLRHRAKAGFRVAFKRDLRWTVHVSYSTRNLIENLSFNFFKNQIRKAMTFCDGQSSFHSAFGTKIRECVKNEEKNWWGPATMQYQNNNHRKELRNLPPRLSTLAKHGNENPLFSRNTTIINLSINQPINQSTKQSVSRSINQSINQSMQEETIILDESPLPRWCHSRASSCACICSNYKQKWSCRTRQLK